MTIYYYWQRLYIAPRQINQMECCDVNVNILLSILWLLRKLRCIHSTEDYYELMFKREKRKKRRKM